MSPKIVISGITSFRNHGVEALVVSTVEQLRKRLSNPTFTILDRSPDYDSHQLKAKDVRFAQDHSIRSLYASKARRLLNRMVPRINKLAQETIREIRAADLVMASGGDVFCSEYGHRSLLSHLTPIRIAQKAGVPTILHAQSIGPFTNAEDCDAFCHVANRATTISVREEASYRYLTKTLGMRPEQCHLVADPAFLLRPSQGVEAGRLFRHFLHRHDRPTIALGISQAICHWMDTNKERHVEVWIQIIQWLRDTLDANIILVPHVQEISPENDDRVLATEIMKRLGYHPAVCLAGGHLSAHDFKSIIAQCDLVIAERMHAAIAGLSSAVPTLVVGYSVKAQGILTDIYGRELTPRALISIQDFLKTGRGLAQVQTAWECRSALQEQLDKSLPDAKRRAAKAFDLAEHALKQSQNVQGQTPSPIVSQASSFGWEPSTS